MGNTLLDGSPTAARFGSSVLQLNLTSSRYDSETGAASDQVGSLMASGSVVRLFASGSDMETNSLQAGLTGSLYFLKPQAGDPAAQKPARILGHNIDESISGAWTFANLTASAGAVIQNLRVADGTDLDGALNVDGATTLNGAVTLGDAVGDDVVITGRIAADIDPKTDNTYDLGSDSLQWKDLYVNGIGYIDQIGTDATPVTGYFNGGEIDDVVIGGESAAAGTFTTLTANGNVVLGDAASDTVTFNADVATDILPSADDSKDLGNGTNRWAEGHIVALHADQLGQALDANSQNITNVGTFEVDGGATFNGAVTLGDASGDDLTINGRFVNDMVPKTAGAVDLGTTSLPFGGIYAGSVSASYIAVDHLDVNTINSVVRTESTLEIADKHIVLASGSSGGAVNGAGFLFGGDGSERGLTEAGSLTWDSTLNGIVISGSNANQVAHVSASGDVYGNDGHFVNRLTVKNGGNIGSDGAYDAMSISSAGIVTFKDDIKIKDGGTIGNASVADVMTLADSGIVTFKDDILIKSAGTIGTADVADSLTWNADGDLTFKDGAYDFDVASHDGTNGLKLGGALVTSTAAELNLLDTATANTVVNSKAVIYGSSGEIKGGTISGSALNIPQGTLSFNGQAVSAEAGELNLLDGSSAGSVVNSKAVIYSSAGRIAATSILGHNAGAGTGLSLDYSSCANAAGKVMLADNGSNALEFQQGTGGSKVSYLKFVSSDDSESVDMGVDLNLAAGASVTADAFVLNSDETLKKDIKTLDSALDKVMSMRGVTYQFKHNPEKQEVGFLAQEMKNSVPEVVSTTNKGTLGIDYAKLTSVLVEAVKEQQEQIEELKAKLSKDNS